MRKVSVLLLGFLIFSVIVMSGVVVKKIEITGNTILKDSEIRELLGIKLRTEIDRETLEASLGSLTDSGYFKNVDYSFDEASGLLSITVEEFPGADVEITFVGPKIADKDTLLASGVTIEDGKPLNPTRIIYEIPRSVEGLTETLKSLGYPEAFFDIEWDTEPDKKDIMRGNVEDHIKIIFKIKPYYLWDVEIEAPLSERALEELKNTAKLKTCKSYYEAPGIIRLFMKESSYVPKASDIASAVRSIFSTYYVNPEGSWGLEKVYRALAFAYSNALKTAREVELPEGVEGQAKIITLSFKPASYIARPMEVKTIFFTGNEHVSSLTLLNAVGIKEEEVIDSEKIAKALQAIQEVYSKEGYPFTKQQVRIDENLGSLTFEITELKVGNINVEYVGEHKTRDYLIKDKIVLKKGEVLSLKDYQNTYAFLNSTGYFDSVVINPIPSDDETLDVKIVLDEKDKNGKIMGGGGWQDGLMLNLDVGFLNPFGYGQDISLKANVNFPVGGSKTTISTDETTGATITETSSPTYDLSFSYIVPKIFASNWDVGLSMKLRSTGKSTEEATETAPDTIEATIKEEREYRIDLALAPTYNLSAAEKIRTSAGFEYINIYTETATELRTATSTEVATSQTANTFYGLYTSLSYSYSTRDDLLRPKNGTEFSARLYARGIFGNEPFAGVMFEFKKFIDLGPLPIAKGLGNPVLGFRARTDQLFPFNEYNKVFETYLLSPGTYLRVKNGGLVVGNDVYGVTAASLQLRVPLVEIRGSMPLDFVLFGDLVYYREGANIADLIGNKSIWDAGVSLEISLPMIGLFRVGWGWNSVYGESTDYSGTFFFGIGPVF